MAEAETEHVEPSGSAASRPRIAMWRWRVSLGLLFILAGIFLYGWSSREQLAGNFIESQLDQMGLQATYQIESIGTTRQVISNLVVGDSANPDFTADRVAVILRYRLGFPTVGRIELQRPRLFGSLRDGELSFGSLDKVIFAETEEPAALPDLDALIIDGRALLVTDFGPVGFKIEGEGELDHGFNGLLAASAPRLEGSGCLVNNARLFTTLRTNSGKAKLDGPVSLATLECKRESLSLRDTELEIQLTSDADLAGGELETRLATGSLDTPWLRSNGVNGTFDAAYRKQRINARYTLALRGAAVQGVKAAVFTANGSLRGSDGIGQIEIQSEIEGNGLRLGDGLENVLANLDVSSSNTLLAPLLRQARDALIRESRGSSFAGELTFRTGDNGTSIVIPRATMRGGSGATLLSLSRVQMGTSAKGDPSFLGNFATGGMGLPRIVGRLERQGKDNPLIRMKMAEYAAEDSRLEIPELVIAQSSGGQFGFSGSIEASGSIPGGLAQGLVVPLSGNWSSRDGLALWRRCTDVRFDRLKLADLTLEQRGLTLCPSSSGAILRSDKSGLRISAGTQSLDLIGSLGGSPIAIRSGPVGIAWPGVLNARDVDITLGPPGAMSQFRLATLDGEWGAAIAGTFEGAEVVLDPVPLDISNASGVWNFADGILAITDGTFRLEDRQEQARFERLIGRDATLTLQAGLIKAFTELREPTSNRVVAAVDIRHSLSDGIGSADLTVTDLVFDDRLQPDQLSNLALGVVANAKGIVTGNGRIDWTEYDVSSSGAFSSAGIDFAAAFGPVGGVSGTVEFTDLVNMTTAPSQKLKLASINPGVEIFDGEFVFGLRDGRFIDIDGGSWPFMGGTLRLRPVKLDIDSNDERRYVLEIEGLDAALFVQNMELGNLTAQGIFDGEVPLVFDADGNGRIENGLLTSRAPGGNLSYVGELTYEDLSAMANFAFDTLRSLNFSRMEVDMNGPLTGEIITRLRFDGVRQGEGAKQNFITKRIAKLPVRFRVNIRADFYSLLTNFKSMYDPAFVRDPRDLGLFTTDGDRFVRPQNAKGINSDLSHDELPIQTPESETVQ